MKPSRIGGQAVLEGVMMKNGNQYAIAVRKPDKEIVIEKSEYKGIAEKIPLFGIPIIRGVVAFIESLALGIKIMTFSASFYEEEGSDDKDKQKKDKEKTDKKGKEAQSGKKMPEQIMNLITVILAVILAVGIFMVLPYLISQLLNNIIESQKIIALFEGIVRILLFVGYISAITLMEDIRRVFMYHGAEHKVINCIENGYDLKIENVKKQSKHHKRCGTSFSLYVIFLSVIFFMFINVSSPVSRLLLRLLLVPVIAGISYEFIKLAGKLDNKFINILSKPGFWLQGLTTKEPDKDMIEVAIASVEAVFDWRAFQNENFNNVKSEKLVKRKESSNKKTDKSRAVPENKNVSESRKTAVDRTISESRKAAERRTTAERRKTADSRSAAENKMEKMQRVEEAQDNELGGLDKVLEAKAVYKSRVKPESVLTRRSDSFNPALSISKEDEEDEVLTALDKYFVFERDENENQDEE